MRDYAKEFENRVAFIRDLLKSSGAKGVIYGNSGGKDSALVGILCKAACDNTVGIMMPCASRSWMMTGRSSSSASSSCARSMVSCVAFVEASQ